MPRKYKQDPKVVVDLRSKFTAIRDQGERPLCLAFSASDLNAFTHSLKDPLSVEYLAHHAYAISGSDDYHQGLTCEAVINVLNTHGQPYEHIHPYSTSFRSPIEFVGKSVELFKANGSHSSTAPINIKKFLDNGIGVILGVCLTNDFFDPIPPYIFDDQYDSVGMHAMVAVGYGKMEDGENVFLVRNSWGRDWANNGNAWLTSSFCENRVKILIGLEI